jgi:hypothetical protein
VRAEQRIAELEKTLAVVRDRLTLLSLPGNLAEIVRTLCEMIDKALAVRPSTRLERLVEKANKKE